MHTPPTLARLAGLVLLPLCLLATASCDRVPLGDGPPEGALTYDMRGRIVAIEPAGDTATIEHEDVPNFMPAMTMPFQFRDKRLLARVRAGDGVAFRFVVTKSDSWVDRLHPIDPADLRLPKAARAEAPAVRPGSVERLREGDAMPNFALVDQDGQPCTPAQFAGAPYVLTFIFTRCPVPEFCPRMTRHFAELQRRLTESGRPQTRLLSISIDSAHDSPPVLKVHAEAYGAQPPRWLFASGGKAEVERLTAAFGVRVQPENGTISHGLCTALVGADGTVRALWRGNGWTPDEVLARLAAE